MLDGNGESEMTNASQSAELDDDLRRQCWDEALNSFGTAYIFEKRAEKLHLPRAILSFVGFALPVIVGGVALTYGADSKALPVVVGVAGMLGLLQLVLVAWSQVANWEGTYYSSKASTAANYDLSARFQALARPADKPREDWQRDYAVLYALSRQQAAADIQLVITAQEKRAGMRAALRQFQRACVSCKSVPESLDPSSCPTCGQF